MNACVRSLLLRGLLFTASGAHVLGAQSAPGKRFPLTATFIAHALQQEGFLVNAEDVRLPMSLSAAAEDPALLLVGADRLPDGHLRMRLRCRVAGNCVPFTVTVTSTAKANTMLTASAAQPPALPVLPSSQATTAFMAAGPTQPATHQEPTQLLDAGAHLTLLVDDGHMHIHLPVIALQRAASGQIIRVTTPDHKQTYRATVIDANTARGVTE